MGACDRYIYSASKSYGVRPNFVSSDQLPNGGFSSLYAVSSETAEAIVAEGTTEAFKGVVGDPQQTLWVDTDTPDSARRVEEKLKSMGIAHDVYTTGNRGLHFAIWREASPSHLLPQRDKAWVEATFGDAADLSIYTHLHLFRLPGTVHEATGRPKKIIRSANGQPVRLPRLERKARTQPQPLTSSPGDSVFSCLRVMANTVPARNGDRHPTLVRLAYALKDDAGVSAEVALWWLYETNKLFPEPKSEDEVVQIVNSIFNARL